MRVRVFSFLVALVAVAAPVVAAVTYRTPQNFLADSFAGQVPPPQVVWLTGQVRADMKRVLGEEVPGARVRYWRSDGRTAWILDEIGKEDPITAGIVIDDGRIASFDVLIYRESRGDEVRFPYFRTQFIDATLTGTGQLDHDIDGISGATLSVRAMTVMARRALFLHQLVMQQPPS